MRRRRYACAQIIVYGVVASLVGQSQELTFDVISIKKRAASTVGLDVNRVIQSGGIYKANARRIPTLIEFAYMLGPKQIVGVPTWAQTQAFDIEARASQQASLEEMRLMMQSLLKQRFGFVSHREGRQLQHYELRLGNSDGRLGPGIRSISGECEREAGINRPTAPPGAARAYGCSPMSGIASLAATATGEIVVDKTATLGTFQYHLFSAPRVRNATGEPTIRTADDPDLPSFPAALQEQLGLKLEASRAVVDVLVVDSVHLPTEN
jgi:uncharacterized protein (TIGR03435 family)